MTIVNELIADVLAKDSSITHKSTSSPRKTIVGGTNINNENCDASETNGRADSVPDNSSVSDIVLDNISINDSENLYFCPSCEQSAQTGSIACEECGEWYHFSCVGLNNTPADAIHSEYLLYAYIVMTIFYTVTQILSPLWVLKKMLLKTMLHLNQLKMKSLCSRSK